MHPIGVMVNNLEGDRLRAFAVARALGFTIVHANAVPEAMLDGAARTAYIRAAQESGLTIATLFVGFDGQDYSNIRSIAATVGFAPAELRDHRRTIALRYSDVAAELNVPSLSTHLGFLPPEPARGEVIATLRSLLDQCAVRAQTLHLETGQESAADLLRLIQQVDRPNLYVNFDPANFVLYGTDHPVPALDLLYPLVRGVHCKDGLPAESPGELGQETPLGHGAVNFPAFLRRLLQLGYTGPLIIEREHGPNVVHEILAARSYLAALLSPTVP